MANKFCFVYNQPLVLSVHFHRLRLSGNNRQRQVIPYCIRLPHFNSRNINGRNRFWYFRNGIINIPGYQVTQHKILRGGFTHFINWCIIIVAGDIRLIGQRGKCICSGSESEICTSVYHIKVKRFFFLQQELHFILEGICIRPCPFFSPMCEPTRIRF